MLSDHYAISMFTLLAVPRRHKSLAAFNSLAGSIGTCNRPLHGDSRFGFRLVLARSTPLNWRQEQAWTHSLPPYKLHNTHCSSVLYSELSPKNKLSSDLFNTPPSQQIDNIVWIQPNSPLQTRHKNTTKPADGELQPC